MIQKIKIHFFRYLSKRYWIFQILFFDKDPIADVPVWFYFLPYFIIQENKQLHFYCRITPQEEKRWHQSPPDLPVTLCSNYLRKCRTLEESLRVDMLDRLIHISSQFSISTMEYPFCLMLSSHSGFRASIWQNWHSFEVRGWPSWPLVFRYSRP